MRNQIMNSNPAHLQTQLANKCKRCGSAMAPGKATEQTWVGGIPDFLGDSAGARGQTVHTGGPGKLIDCSKCVACGWSVTV